MKIPYRQIILEILGGGGDNQLFMRRGHYHALFFFRYKYTKNILHAKKNVVRAKFSAALWLYGSRMVPMMSRRLTGFSRPTNRTGTPLRG